MASQGPPGSTSRLQGLMEWGMSLFGLEGLREIAEHKTVPRHRHSIWYYFGGMTLFLFGIQVVTGILLLLYYRPSAEEAHSSVEFIMTRVPFGWLVRSIHSWSANLMIGMLMVHMFSVFFMKAYRSPRMGTWFTGVVLYGLALGFGFSGYLLPWTDLSFFATKVGTEIPGGVPVVGPFLVHLLRGGRDVTGGTLTRFFGFHVAVLPALTTAVLGIHLLLVQRKGMSVPPSIEANYKAKGEEVPSMRFVPNFALRDLFGWLVMLLVLAALAALKPWELLPKADPFGVPSANIRPEWYFLWMFQTLKKLPQFILGVAGEQVGVMAFGLLGLLWLLVPVLDRRPGTRGLSRLFTWAGLLGIFFIVGMTLWCLLETTP